MESEPATIEIQSCVHDMINRGPRTQIIGKAGENPFVLKRRLLTRTPHECFKFIYEICYDAHKHLGLVVAKCRD